MVRFLFVFALAFLFGCVEFDRDNPLDPGSSKYPVGTAPSSGSQEQSSVSQEPSSSSSVPSSSSVTPPSSSSVVPSSSSVVPSSSSALPSSSSIIPSSSSVVPSSSSIVPSSSSVVAISSSSSVPSSSSLAQSSSSSSPIVYGSVYYEGQEYKTVVIVTQTWIAENLNYNVSGSKCYNNLESNCDTYGRLYDWATAMALPSSCNSSSCPSQIKSPHRGICPVGWHIPSDAEWTTLTNNVGGLSTAGTKLKAESGWNSNGNGTDDYEFSALPGGYGFSNGNFYDVGDRGYWWSSMESFTEEGFASYAYRWHMYYSGATVYRGNVDRLILYSVRCVKD